MIYTVTFNPAIDYIVYADGMKIGCVNRSVGEDVQFGGKGINVSAVLAALGVKSRALGFVAGFTGEALEREIAKKGIETDFVHLSEGFTRINVKIKADAETELNGQGPKITEADIEKLYKKMDKLADGDTLVLAGSIPNGLPNDIYEKILARFEKRNIKAVVDATGDLLLNVLKYKPFLVKPNNYELGEMFGVNITDEDDIFYYGRKLKEMGAVNVLISRAGDGAVLIDEHGEEHKCPSCRGTVKNSVGAGDSMVAGFLTGAATGDYRYALKLGTAAGGATAFSEKLAEKDEIYKLIDQL